ncbi:LysR family transcriptional regulator ArgP [Dyella sp. GSA-30]|uniref:LysR family transcriptional regulator ArgP n=1 Tax=Dyella sp. GSA-30 TaxID=2994496 RepID=UPI0024936D8A|nr:LysR family transcriptional regulator ArgP [Dyella sp. GSA-30]BDU23131.1 chromosome replication initiation inhibitor protein [Dyella sp. GSA-30]
MSLIHPQLTALAAVLDEGSFERAALRLSLTPSAISQRIKALEDRLGQILVLRQSPCRATDAGKRLLRSLQQMRLLETEALDDFGIQQHETPTTTISIAVNADSLATWFLDALADLHKQHGLLFDIHVEDQDHSTNLLREGAVLGAVTADAHPVQGCNVEPLGVMRYLPVASPQFVERYVGKKLDAAALAAAPMLVFNRKDELQSRFIRSVTRARVSPPVHYLPSSTAFVDAAAMGLGWAMAPETMARDRLASGALRVLAARRWLDVPLYWQHWSIRAETLGWVSDTLRRVAAARLRKPGVD